MNHLNSILIEGNVSIGPRIVTTSQNGASLAVFSLANNRYYQDASGNKKTETLFIEVACWGDMAASCMNVVEVGMHVRVVGRLRQCTWKSREGEERSKVQIVALHLEYRKKTPGLGEQELVISGSDDDVVQEPVVYYEY